MGSPYSEADEEERKKVLQEPTPFPEAPEYADLVRKYHAHEMFARALALKIVEYLCLGLGKDRNFLRSWFEPAPLSTFRTIKYLPRS